MCAQTMLKDELLIQKICFFGMKAIYLPLFFSRFRGFLNHPSRLAASCANLFFCSIGNFFSGWDIF